MTAWTSLSCALVRRPFVRPLVASFVCVAAISGQSVKLNGPLAQPLGGNVGSPVTTPDGSRVVYWADQEVDERYELYSVPRDGGQAPVKLSDPLHGDVHFTPARITPDGATVVYLTDEPALFRVPIDGSAAPLELAGDIAFQDMSRFRFEISADGQWVVFREDDPARLLAVPTDGSLYPISLAPPGSVAIGTDFSLSPDSSRVAFRAGALDAGFELYSVPIDGSVAPVRLNVPFSEATQNVSSFQISPDGLSVVHVVHDARLVDDGYGGIEEVPEAYQLFSAVIDGTAAPVELSEVFPDPVSVQLGGKPAITPDSARVIYQADTLVDDRYELFSLLLDGSSDPVRLNGNHASSVPYGITSAHLTADGRRVVYLTAGRELFSAPIDRERRAVKLCADGAFVDAVELASTGERVLYRARLPGRDVSDLFSVASNGVPANRRPLRHDAGSQSGSVRLAQDVYDFKLHPDGTTALYESRPPHALYAVDVTGRGEVIELVSGFVAYLAVPGERALFLPFPTVQTPGWQLYSVPLEGGQPVRLNLPLPLGPVVGRIHDFAASPGGDWTVYLADGELRRKYELYSVPSDGSLPAVRISDEGIPNGSVGGYDPKPGAFRITPDGTRVVYLADRDKVGVHDLFVVPIDGSSPASRLTEFTSYGGVQHGFEIAPDGEHAAFLALLPNGPFSTVRRLHGVRLDGSAPAVLLSGAPAIGSSVASFAISPDSARAVYRSDEQAVGRFELFSVPIEGGPPVELQPVTTFHSDVGAYRVSADGTRVIYLFHPSGSGAGQLYSIPIDGSAPRQGFDPLDGMVTAFELTPDGLGVVYSLNQGANFQFVYELYLAPLDASASLRLNPPIVQGVSLPVSRFGISPDGSRVVYLADQEIDGRAELYSVPMDGSQELVKLSAPLAPGASIWWDFRISPDGSRVVFFTDTSTVGVHELYSVPIEGGEPPARLNGPIPPGGGFELTWPEETPALELAGARVAFALDGEVAGRVELYVALLDGRTAAVKVNGPPKGDTSDALPFTFAGANRLVYLAPEELPGVPELFTRSQIRVSPHPTR